MKGWKGFLTGVVGLALFSTVVQSVPVSKTAGLFASISGFVAAFMDPSKPGIPAKASYQSPQQFQGSGGPAAPSGGQKSQVLPGPFGGGPSTVPGAVGAAQFN